MSSSFPSWQPTSAWGKAALAQEPAEAPAATAESPIVADAPLSPEKPKGSAVVRESYVGVPKDQRPAYRRGRPFRTVSVSVRKLELKLGDVVAITIPDGSPPADMLRIAEAIRQSVPPGVATILLANGMTLEQLRVDGLVPAGPEGVFVVEEGEEC